MIIVNATHWLNEDGSLPDENPKFRRLALRMACFIEYGANLPVRHARETLVACRKRPKRKPCPGLMWVAKWDDNRLVAFCPACGVEEFLIDNWQDTPWADGYMEPIPVQMC